jgi:hypothetical protein
MNQPSPDRTSASPASSLGARLGRHLLFLAMALVVMLLALHGCMSMHQGQKMDDALARAEERWGPLDVPEPDRPRPADESNAAVLLRAAVAVHVLDTANLPAFNRLKQGQSLQAGDRQALQAIVDDNAESLALLDDAQARPHVDWRAEPPAGSHQQSGVPPYSRLLPLAGTNWTSGMLAAIDGDAAGAVAAVQRQLLLGLAMETDGHLLPQVLRIRVISRALDLIRATLERTAPDPAQLEILRAGLQDLAGGEALHQSLISQFKNTTRHYLGMLHGNLELGEPAGAGSDDSFDLRAIAVERAGRTLRGENPMTPKDAQFLGSTALRWVVRPWLRSRMTRYVEDSDALLGWQAIPPYRRQDEAAVIRSGKPPANDWLSRIFPDLEVDTQLLAMGDLVDARLALARTAVALCLARAVEGRYPGTLADLVPGFMAEVPVDPLTGEAPIYRHAGSGVVLASARVEFEAEATRNAPWGPTGLLSWSLPN